MLMYLPTPTPYTWYVDYIDNERYHKFLNNLEPLVVYEGREGQILYQLEKIKQRTLWMRRKLNLGNVIRLS